MMNRPLIAIFVLFLCACGGGENDENGYSNPSSNDTYETPDSDNDGTNDIFDDYADDANNINDIDGDTDGDGVANRFDVFPYDSSKAKAVVINLKGATSIGLGEALSNENESEQILTSTFVKNNPRINSLLDIFIPKAHASTTTSISNLTNVIAWNEQGQVLNGSILSSETLFIAEAGLTPDGRYLYLLTSNHMQRAIDDIDDEVCSIYKVYMEDYKIECLLASDLGDIEPGSLKGTMQTDYSRSGIDFRSDGAGVMTGFDWAQELPSGVNGGTNSTIAWFLTSEGQLTSLLHEEGYFAVSALWLNDEYFAIAEYPFLGEDGPINPDHAGRIVIYNANDLSIHKRISAENIWGPTVRANGDIFWQYGGALDGETLEKYPSPIDGIPVTDNQSSMLYGLVDYLGTENTLSSADKSTQISLSDGIATGYEWRKGSGTGTDISYRTFAFNNKHIAYIKSFGAAEPIVSIDEYNLNNERLDIALSDDRGRLLINSNAKDQWFIAPSSEQDGDLTIDYQVQTDTGIENRQLIISELTIDNWRSDASRPSIDSDARFEDAAIKWASPSPEREGICIYQFAMDDSVCALPQGNVVKTDMETFRSTRYDNEAVYPNGTGNAYPGIRNIFFDNSRMRVFYKDSDNHQYYQAVAEIDDFLVNGASAFTYTNAVNGQGEQNIITESISLKPAQALIMEGITLSMVNSQTVNVNFPKPLSLVAPTPILTLSQNDQLISQNGKIIWNESRTLATIQLNDEIENLSEVVVRTLSSIFVPDSIQQYKINDDDFSSGVAPIDNLSMEGEGIINEPDNDGLE